MALNIEPNRRRWWIVGIIFIAIVFNYVDRQIVSILKPEIKEEFGIDDSGYAHIVNLFTICYALMYPVTGWLVDKLGPRLVMMYGIMGWSLACIGGGLSRTVTQFGVCRAILGLAEPTNFPAQLKVVAIWFPDKLRATANSLCVAGSSIGAIIAPPLIAWLASQYGWHAAFFVPGAIGLLIVVAWKLVYTDPPAETTARNLELSSGGQSLEKAFTWGQLWKTRSLYAILAIRFISDPVWYFCLFWLPGYLREESGMTLAQIGMFGWIPYLMADLGGVGTSAWSDWLVRRGHKPLTARKIMLVTVALFGSFAALTPYAPNAYATIFIFGVVAAVCISWLFSLSVVIAETFPLKNVASVLGIAGGFGAAGAFLFNHYIGQIMGTVGANRMFLIMAFLHPVSALILWLVVRPEKPDDFAAPTVTNNINPLEN